MKPAKITPRPSAATKVSHKRAAPTGVAMKAGKPRKPRKIRMTHGMGSGGTPLPRARYRKLTTDLLDTVVLIDDRAGSRELIRYPPFDQCGELCRLDSADVAFLGNGPNGQEWIGVELKRLDDLLASCDNGRLQDTQLRKMLGQYESSWLLYYGKHRPAPGTHALQVWHKGQWRNHYVGNRAVPYGYLKGSVIELQEIGLNMDHVEDMGEAAAWLAELVRWRSKPWEKHKLLRAFDESRKITSGRKRKNRASLMPTLDEHTERKARTILPYPTMGYERSVVAARHFKSARQMANASAEEWSELATVDRKSGKKKRFGPVAGDAIAAAWRLGE